MTLFRNILGKCVRPINQSEPRFVDTELQDKKG